jgi:hypothetical protein
LQYTQQNSTKMLISTVQFSTTTPEAHPADSHEPTGQRHWHRTTTHSGDIPEPQQCAHPSSTDRHSTRAHPPPPPHRGLGGCVDQTSRSHPNGGTMPATRAP